MSARLLVIGLDTLDLAPTLWTLLDVPPSSAMEGRPIAAMVGAATAADR